MNLSCLCRLQLLSLVNFVQHLLGGQLTFSPVVVHSVVGDSGQLPAAVVFIVDVVCHVLQVLHVSSRDRQTNNSIYSISSLSKVSKCFFGNIIIAVKQRLILILFIKTLIPLRSFIIRDPELKRSLFIDCLVN